MQHKDVFISYRRQGGATVARLIKEILEQRGVTVFFDAESLQSGDFTQQIARSMKAADTVLLIVSPSVFDRCGDINDWVRKEIEFALQSKKKIIPIFVNGETGFPADLPESISKIKNQNGIEFSHDNFDEALGKLIGQIKTKKDQMLDAWLQMDEDQYGVGEINRIVSDFHEYFVETNFKKWEFFCKLIRNSYIKELKKENLNFKNISKIFSGYTLENLKYLCEKLKIDDRGGRCAVLESIYSFVNNEYLERDEFGDKNEDRYEIFIQAVVREYGNKIELKNELSKFLDGNRIRTAEEAASAAFAEDGDEVARILKHLFREESIRNIYGSIMPDNAPKVRMNGMLDRILEYINYRGG